MTNRTMDPLIQLLHRHPLAFIHRVAARAALAPGAVLPLRRNDTTGRCLLGWTRVGPTGSTALASAFIRDEPGRFLGSLSWAPAPAGLSS